MNFQTRELRFRLIDKSKFKEQEVRSALRAQGFADVAFQTGPT
jgi:hypothetical protein